MWRRSVIVVWFPPVLMGIIPTTRRSQDFARFFHFGVFHSVDVLAIVGSFLRAGAEIDAIAGFPERLSAERVLSLRTHGNRSPPPSILLGMLAGFRAAGCSWKAYKRGPHMAMLLLRSLRARGRAVATPDTSGYVDRLTSPNLPCGVAWKILEYWRATE